MNQKRADDTCPACGGHSCRPGGASRRQFLQATGFLGIGALIAAVASKDPAARPIGRLEAAGDAAVRRYPIPSADGVSIDRASQLILVRASGHVYVFALSCPHQNNAVKWVPKDNRFQCTKHDSQYQVDGVHTSGRATRNLDRYVIRRDGDSIVVDLHKWVRSDQNPAGWAAATIAI